MKWQQAISTLIHQASDPGLKLGTLASAFSALTTMPRLTADLILGDKQPIWLTCSHLAMTVLTVNALLVLLRLFMRMTLCFCTSQE